VNSINNILTLEFNDRISLSVRTAAFTVIGAVHKILSPFKGFLMPTIPLTQGESTSVDDGDFKEIGKYKWSTLKLKHTCYARGWVDGKVVYMHRMLMGNPKGLDVDHINGNGLDNRRCNLRVCNRSQNSMNNHKRTGTSKYKGVSWYKRGGKWHSQIMIDGIQKHIAYFDDEIEAAKSYDIHALELFKEYACLNFPEKFCKTRG
jgi:hypothetical protein